jgi:hypothetical protein
VTTTRQGWLSARDLSFLVFFLVAGGSLPLLASGGASVQPGNAGASDDCVLSDSSGAPVWTAESEGHRQNLPDGDRDDVDDSDSDGDDDDDASALPGASILLTADRGHARPLIERACDAPSTLQSEGCSLRGPPRLTLDELTCSLDRHISDQTSRPPAWTPADSDRHPSNSSDDNRDDVNDRDEDDDDGNDEGGSALPTVSTDLIADDADARRVIQTEIRTPSLVGSEAHALRGPPKPSVSDAAPSACRNIPDHTSRCFVSDGHSLRAPPAVAPHSVSKVSRNHATETRSRS